MFEKRITLFMGHYGSGKTFGAVNYALALKSLNKNVSIYDLDIVNPYFRTVDAEKILKEKGVGLIVSPFAETNVDIPAMNSASYKMVDDLSEYAVVDIGGDDRGALALGRFRDKILCENNYDALLVVNPYRPETSSIDGAVEIKQEIENVSKIKFTGIVNNSNLGDETDEKTITYGLDFCENLACKLKIPVKFSSVRKDLITEELRKKIPEILPLTKVEYKIW